jgi:hypothetical protein
VLRAWWARYAEPTPDHDDGRGWREGGGGERPS